MADSDPWNRWIAQHVLNDLRAGIVPEGLTPARFSWNPTVIEMRALVTLTDREVVAGLLEQEATLMWGAFLGRAFPGDQEVTGALLDAFRVENDLERRVGLFHHLTARELDDSQYVVLRNWLNANAVDFLDEQHSAFADAEGPDRLRDRLTSDNPDFVQKRWVYMYSSLVLGSAEARPILEAQSSSDDSRVAEAAKGALSLIDSGEDETSSSKS